jgi:glutathione S-transferase
LAGKARSLVTGHAFLRSPDARSTQVEPARQQLRASAALLDTQLADGRPFLLGAELILADAACYHPVWFLRSISNAGTVFDEFANLLAWADRIRTLGHGQRQDIDPAEALRVARDSTPLPGRGVDGGEPNGLAAGMRVAVVPDDYGFDPVVGELVTADPQEVAVRRHDPELGDLVVHFPRIGFQVRPA